MSIGLCFNELPPEIHGVIFFEFLEQSKDHNRELLAKVCKQWKRVVESTPGCWSRIIVDVGWDEVGRPKFGAKAYRMQLKLAKRWPLAVIIHENVEVQPWKLATPHVKALYGLIKDHQWRTLSISCYSTSHFTTFFQHILDNPQSCKLSSLVIHTSINHGPKTQALIAAVLLQTPTITNLGGSPDLLGPSHPLPDTLQSYNAMDPLDLSYLLPIVQRASQLKNLCVSGPSWTFSEIEFRSPASLLDAYSRSLERLIIRNIKEIPTSLLSRLRLPSLHTFALEWICCAPISGDESMRCFIQSAPWVSQITFFTMNEVWIQGHTLIQALRAMPALTRLHLSSGGQLPFEILKALYQPTSASMWGGISPPQSETNKEWLAPRLEEFVVVSTWRVPEDCLKALVFARVCDAVDPIETSNPNLLPPVRIRKLVWNSRDLINEMLGASPS
ncbi:hypothetical protein FRB98_009206 [Tulasnella sp. 332]|nr:hypothetical protein FRB98_009206 [Tulasnella sp. 332]